MVMVFADHLDLFLEQAMLLRGNSHLFPISSVFLDEANNILDF